MLFNISPFVATTAVASASLISAAQIQGKYPNTSCGLIIGLPIAANFGVYMITAGATAPHLFVIATAAQVIFSLLALRWLAPSSQGGERLTYNDNVLPETYKSHWHDDKGEKSRIGSIRWGQSDSVLSVFDGDGQPEFFKEVRISLSSKVLNKKDNLPEAYKTTFDEAVGSKLDPSKPGYVTAASLYIDKYCNKVIATNVGNTAIVLMRKNGEIVELSKRHTLSDEKELARLKEIDPNANWAEKLAEIGGNTRGFFYNPRKPLIANAVTHKPHVSETTSVKPGDRVVIITNSVYRAIAHIIDSIDSTAVFEELRDRISRLSEEDSLTEQIKDDYNNPKKENSVNTKFEELRDMTALVYTVPEIIYDD